MSADDCPLPDPEGPLSIRIPSSSIEVANKEVKLILNEVHAGNGKKCVVLIHMIATNTRI